jgi:hypothetical protein
LHSAQTAQLKESMKLLTETCSGLKLSPQIKVALELVAFRLLACDLPAFALLAKCFDLTDL